MHIRLVLPVALALLLGACLQREEVVTQDIVSVVPWPDEERAEYLLLDADDEEEIGEATLSIERQGGRYELGASSRSTGEGPQEEDESVVVVDAETLKPLTVRREILQDGETSVLRGEYDEAADVIRITEEDADGDERTVPRRLEDNYYDNESAIFLWRTVPFEEGYEARYHTVQIQGAQPIVTVRVTGRETVTVPAGTFQTWRLELKAGGVEQTAWYADTPERLLVQYDNSRSIFRLTSPEAA
jgi:hypothetical protein